MGEVALCCGRFGRSPWSKPPGGGVWGCAASAPTGLCLNNTAARLRSPSSSEILPSSSPPDDS